MTDATIRPLQPGDLLAVRGQPKRELFLSPDGLSAQACGPTWTTFLPWGASGYGLVHESALHGPAQVYACPRPRRDKWDVVYLAGPADLDDDVILDVWQSLLERLCQEAGRRGTLRVFARLAEHDAADAVAEVMDAFRRAGFVVYGRDTIWRREGEADEPLQPAEPVSAVLRPQHRADAWNLHGLYRALAPPLVQQSEGLTSRDWRPPGRRWFGNGPRAYVLILAGEIKGHVYVGGGGEPRLRLLAHPDAREALQALLAAGLAELGIDLTRPLTVLVPEYGGWAVGLLEQAGFRHTGTQSLLVKHTVAWAHAPEPHRRPVMKEVLEPAPSTPAAPAAANGDRA